MKKVIRELNSSCYRPITSLLGSRDQMCIKPELKGLAVN